ncbi:MAG: nicotinate-nucleotide adenylyltransferase [Dehalococcoidia bacterium]
MRLGVLGGTFDPVHSGHLIIAEEARLKLSLDQVLFVPAGQPWFKQGSEITPAAARLEMLRRAVDSNPRFCIDTQELDRPGLSYTVDTIEELRRRLGPEAVIYFVIGVDALSELPSWKDPQRLIKLCCFAAMKRPGYTQLDIETLERALPGVAERVRLVDNLQVDISSSDVRKRVEEGLSIRYMVPGSVERYITENNLYRSRGR